MKQRKTFAIVLTIILILATVLTVFAAFRFEVQFPSKLNTFKYDQSQNLFTGQFESELNLVNPGDDFEFQSWIVGHDTTPLAYSYKLSLKTTDATPVDINASNADDHEELLNSIFVYLNDKIVGTLYSVIKDHAGMVGKDLYVLPGKTVEEGDDPDDTIRFELHLASNSTPYNGASLSLTVNCTATNHNAQQMSFVRDAAELAQAISEVNRGAADKTIVMYGGFEVPANLEVQKPCTFDVQDVTFAGPIAVNITSAPVDGVPTDIVTVLSTKSTCAAASGFSITAGAIDRKDSASNIAISGIENATSESVQYIVDNQFGSVEAHGITAGTEIDFSGKGFGCYIDSIAGSSLLTFADNKLTAGSTTASTVETVTITLTTGATHTHNIKVIGSSDAVLTQLLEGELKYLKDLTATDLSFSIPLPTVIKSKNATIEWKTSDPDKVSATGMCAPDANGYVTLTAVIRINDTIYTENFTYYTATLTNQDRLEAMISAMGNLTLNAIAQKNKDGTYTYNASFKDHVTLPTTTGSKQTMGTTELSTFDISKLWFEIDPTVYDFITFTTPHTCTETDKHETTLEHATGGDVVLEFSTFETLAQVKVNATFESGAPETVSSYFYINIELGDDSTLGDKILAYVQAQMNAVDVLQNMLDTRETGVESGNFTMPVEYHGFTIQYTVGINDAEIAQVNNDTGAFTVVPSKFKTSAHDVTVTVEVLSKNTGSTPSAIAQAEMYFTVPPVITNDQYGFAGDDLFFSIREQVMAAASPAYHADNKGKTDAASAYILQRDLGGEKATITTLVIDGDALEDQITSINGLAYFDKLTNLTIKNFSAAESAALAQTAVRAAATFGNLENLTLSNIGMTDMAPLESLSNLVTLDLSHNAGLTNITSLIKYDATQLKTLNISSTGVDMEYARPMLTEMYYEYAAANTTSEQKTPKYYYTHGYTPVADGALLLEPDAISVSFDASKNATVTVTGENLMVTNATFNNDKFKINAGASGGTIRIDDQKQLNLPENVEISIISGTRAGNTVTDAILQFTLSATQSSTATVIQELLSEGDIIITNATLNGTTIHTGEGSVLTANGGSQLLQTGLDIPILSGLITQKDLITYANGTLTVLEAVTLSDDATGQMKQLPAGVYKVEVADKMTVDNEELTITLVGRGMTLTKTGEAAIELLTSEDKNLIYKINTDDQWSFADDVITVSSGLVGLYKNGNVALMLDSKDSPFPITQNDTWSVDNNVLTVNGKVVMNDSYTLQDAAYQFDNTDSWSLNNGMVLNTVGAVTLNNNALTKGDHQISLSQDWEVTVADGGLTATLEVKNSITNFNGVVLEQGTYTIITNDNFDILTDDNDNMYLRVNSGYITLTTTNQNFEDITLGVGAYPLTNCEASGTAGLTASSSWGLFSGWTHGQITIGDQAVNLSSEENRSVTYSIVNASKIAPFENPSLSITGVAYLKDSSNTELMQLGESEQDRFAITDITTEYALSDISTVSLTGSILTVNGSISIEGITYTSGNYALSGKTIYLDDAGNLVVSTNTSFTYNGATVNLAPNTYPIAKASTWDYDTVDGVPTLTADGQLALGELTLPTGVYTLQGHSGVTLNGDVLSVIGYVTLNVIGEETGTQHTTMVNLSTGDYLLTPYSSLTLSEETVTTAEGEITRGVFTVIGDVNVFNSDDSLSFSDETYNYQLKNVIFVSALDSLNPKLHTVDGNNAQIQGNEIVIKGGTLTGSTVAITNENGGTITVDGNVIYVKKGFNLQLTSGMLANVAADGTVTILSLEVSDVTTSSLKFTNMVLQGGVNDTITMHGVSFDHTGITVNSAGGSLVINGYSIPIEGDTHFAYPTNSVIRKDDTDSITIFPRGFIAQNLGTYMRYSNGNFTIVATVGHSYTITNATGTGLGTEETGTITVGDGGGLLNYQGYYFYVNEGVITVTGSYYRGNYIDWFNTDPGYFTPNADGSVTHTFQNGSDAAKIPTAAGSANNFNLDLSPVYNTIFQDAAITMEKGAIDPPFATVKLATLEGNTTSIADGKVTYTGTNFTDIKNVLQNNGLTWTAVIVDGEHVSISDGATYTIADGKLVVTGGTSTIGKGALLTTDADVNVNYNTFTGNSDATFYVFVDNALQQVKVTYSTVGGFTYALVDDILFEPYVLHEDEETGLKYLFLLSEVPTMTHTPGGAYLQVADRIYYANGKTSYVNVAWNVVEGGNYLEVDQYLGKMRFQTLDLTDATDAERAAGTAIREVTLRAQVNVDGKLTERYFTFTVTYYL